MNYVNHRFQNWFHNSKVTDKLGHPLAAHRGEHGAIDCPIDSGPSKQAWEPFQTRLGVLSFGSLRAANCYALKPNQRDDLLVTPRVITAFLSIQNPIMNRPDDPFVELIDIARALGEKRAKEIAINFEDHIVSTNNWSEGIGLKFANFKDYFLSSSFRLEEIYFNAYALLDDWRYVEMFKNAGFDGAIHGGSGETFGESELKVFSAKQVWPFLIESACYEKLAR